MNEPLVSNNAEEEQQQFTWSQKLTFLKLYMYMCCCQCACLRRKSPPKEPPLREVKVLLIGCDGAGKTSLVSRMKGLPDTENLFSSPLGDTESTTGFAIQQVKQSPYLFSFWEVGGNPAIRKYWQKYIKGIRAVVYVIDGTDHKRLDESLDALVQFLSSTRSMYWPLLILINKSESGSSVTLEEVQEKLDFGDHKPQQVHMCPVSALPEGILSKDLQHQEKIYSTQLCSALGWLVKALQR